MWRAFIVRRVKEGARDGAAQSTAEQLEPLRWQRLNRPDAVADEQQRRTRFRECRPRRDAEAVRIARRREVGPVRHHRRRDPPVHVGPRSVQLVERAEHVRNLGGVKGAELRLPIYLNPKLQSKLERIARRKGKDVTEMVNQLLRKDIEFLEELT